MKRSRSLRVYTRSKKRRRISYGAKSTFTGRRRKYSAAKQMLRRKLRRSYNKLVVPRPMGLVRPARIMVKLPNVISDTLSFTVAGNAWSSDAVTLLPLRLRDIDSTVQTQPYPAEFVDWARLYSKYRVHGVKIYCQMSNVGGIADNKSFYSLTYAVPGNRTGATPSDPYTVADVNDVNAILQERHEVRKVYVNSSSEFQRGGARHNLGYWSIKKIQAENDIDPSQYEGAVNESGASVNDPAIKPIIIHKLVAADVNGMASDLTVEVRYFITFYVEMYGHRRDLSTTQGE